MRFTDPSRRRIGLAYLIWILAGVFGAIVKWDWEVPFPPRNPFVFFPLDAGERVTPPKIFLEQLGLPTDWFYIFSGMEMPLSIFIVHTLFSVVFGVMYCVIAEYWPRIKMWQGAVWIFCLSLCSCDCNAFALPCATTCRDSIWWASLWDFWTYCMAMGDGSGQTRY